MPYTVPTSNSGSTYFNTNQCFSFNDTFDTTLKVFSAQPCSEVIIWNRTGETLYVYDHDRIEDDERLAIPVASAAAPLQPWVIRGLTNAEQVSAKTDSGSGLVYWRTQFFSNNPSR